MQEVNDIYQNPLELCELCTHVHVCVCVCVCVCPCVCPCVFIHADGILAMAFPELSWLSEREV